MTNAQLPSEIAIDYLYKVLQKIPELQLTPKNPESRTKNLLFFVGKNAKELYVIRNRESTRILIEHSLTSSITGVREDKLAAPYQGATVKKAAKGRRISVNNQHTVYVDSPESLKKLLTWYANTENTVSSTNNAAHPFTDAEIGDLKLQSEETENLLVGFDGVDKYAVAKGRANQGEFRKLLLRYWKNQCCVSDVADPRLLVASHIIPWSKASAAEKGDPANGLLLSVTWDALFDRGLISFRGDGSAILDKLDTPLRLALGLDEKKSTISQVKLTSKHGEYLKRHRELFKFASNA